VIAVASSFAALTRPRPFRSGAFGARGAADVLVGEVARGHADAVTVKLLVHALRGGRGRVQEVRFGQERPGQAPSVNRHTRVSAPERSPV
jgi:HD-GYP domain-containing protein (c-di-GMP phosphodiesterase class II)